MNFSIQFPIIGKIEEKCIFIFARILRHIENLNLSN